MAKYLVVYNTVGKFFDDFYDADDFVCLLENCGVDYEPYVFNYDNGKYERREFWLD